MKSIILRMFFGFLISGALCSLVLLVLAAYTFFGWYVIATPLALFMFFVVGAVAVDIAEDVSGEKVKW